jgi:hypothetical protein
LLAKNEYFTSRGDVSPIEIPFKASGEGCSIKLWYWMSTTYYASLKISTRVAIGEMWNDIFITASSTSAWAKIEAEIPVGVDFQVETFMKRNLK